MRRLITLSALAAVVALPTASPAAMTFPVAIAGFQYAPSGAATVDPLNATGGAGSVVVLQAGLPVKRGDTIQFTNLDPVPHTVTKMSGPSGTWTSLSVAALGGIKSLTISASFPLGAYTYKCTIHLGMRGVFVVS